MSSWMLGQSALISDEKKLAPTDQAVRKLRNGILEERKKGSRTPRRQRKRAISKLWKSFFQGRRLARSFRTVCDVGGYGGYEISGPSPEQRIALDQAPRYSW